MSEITELKHVCATCRHEERYLDWWYGEYEMKPYHPCYGCTLQTSKWEAKP
jgi:hypothetical protein